MLASCVVGVSRIHTQVCILCKCITKMGKLKIVLKTIYNFFVLAVTVSHQILAGTVVDNAYAKISLSSESN